MTTEAVLREVPCEPVRHSWYHFSCFHQMLGYALLRDLPWGMDYVAAREAVYALEAAVDYPFFQVRHHDQPDQRLSWDTWPDIDPDRLRAALAGGVAVFALRDLYDVAGFRHFGRSHHPNWYLLTGFDREHRTFTAFAEEGGLDAALDARRYHAVELTEAEVMFTGRRSAQIFAEVMGIFPHYPALAATVYLGTDAMTEQEDELEAALWRRLHCQELLAESADCVERFAAELDGQALHREQVVLRVWGRKFRALQVLAARREAYRGCGEATTAAMRCIDELLASGLFWQAQVRAGRLDRARLASRQRFVANGLRQLGQAEVAVAGALFLSRGST